jgi:signal transduction histidine kinase
LGAEDISRHFQLRTAMYSPGRLAPQQQPSPDAGVRETAGERFVVPLVGAHECLGLLSLNEPTEPLDRQDPAAELARVSELATFALAFLEAAVENRNQAELNQLVRRYLESDEIPQFSDLAARTAATIANAAAAALCYQDMSDEQEIRLAGLWGFSRRYEQLESFAASQSISGQVIEAGKPTLLPSLADVRNVVNLPLLLSEGFVSAAAVPVDGKKLKGCLIVYAKDSRDFHATTVTSLSKMGALLGALTEARMQAFRVDALTNELGHAGHSLRNPMTAVGNNVKALGRLLGGETASPEAKRLLENTYLELERANRRITSLLLGRKNILDITGLDIRTVDLSRVLTTCVTRHEPHAEARRIRLVLYDSAKNVPRVEGDEDKLDLLFDNLIENAVKYSWAKQPIEIRASSNASTVTVSVGDKGLGIPAEYYDLIFQGYTRSPVLDSTRYISGTGLGLQIVKLIATAHGGDVSVTSKPFLADLQRQDRLEGFETIFTVTLPRKRAA